MFPKTDWAAVDQALRLQLHLSQNPVAIKFLRTKAELADYPAARPFEKPGTPCMAIGLVGYHELCVSIDADHYRSDYCAAANGCHAKDAEWYSGKFLCGKWFESLEASAAHIRAMDPDCPAGYEAIVFAPLAMGAIAAPDVICISCQPGSGFFLLSALIERSYRRIEFSFIGESSCADSWCHTFVTGKPGLSLGCRGDRSHGALQNDEIRVTLTPADLLEALGGFDRLRKNGLTYPFYPRQTKPDF